MRWYAHATSSAASQKSPTQTGRPGPSPIPIGRTLRSASSRHGHPLHSFPAAKPEIRFEMTQPPPTGDGQSFGQNPFDTLSIEGLPPGPADSPPGADQRRNPN